MPDRRRVVLVDDEGRPYDSAEKRAVHTAPGHLHLAFSALVFRPDGALLVQQRASSKYHFPGIWANTCCSHPEPGEDLVASAERRLEEELGITCRLEEAGHFTYRAEDPVSGLVEHEFDHVLVGEVPAGMDPAPDPDEVQAWRWMEVGEGRSWGTAEGFSPWFAEALEIALCFRRSPG